MNKRVIFYVSLGTSIVWVLAAFASSFQPNSKYNFFNFEQFLGLTFWLPLAWLLVYVGIPWTTKVAQARGRRNLGHLMLSDLKAFPKRVIRGGSVGACFTALHLGGCVVSMVLLCIPDMLSANYTGSKFSRFYDGTIVPYLLINIGVLLFSWYFFIAQRFKKILTTLYLPYLVFLFGVGFEEIFWEFHSGLEIINLLWLMLLLIPFANVISLWRLRPNWAPAQKGRIKSSSESFDADRYQSYRRR